MIADKIKASESDLEKNIRSKNTPQNIKVLEMAIYAALSISFGAAFFFGTLYPDLGMAAKSYTCEMKTQAKAEKGKKNSQSVTVKRQAKQGKLKTAKSEKQKDQKSKTANRKKISQKHQSQKKSEKSVGSEKENEVNNQVEVKFLLYELLQ